MTDDQQAILDVMPTRSDCAKLVVDIARAGPFGTTKTRRLLWELHKLGAVRWMNYALNVYTVGRYHAWYNVIADLKRIEERKNQT